MYIKQCRMCKSSELELFLDLGYQPPSESFRTEEELKDAFTSYPLQVVMCKDCGLHQLNYVVSPNITYGENYPYTSNVTKTGRDHFFSFADSVTKEFNLTDKDLVLDIGSNIGVLLEGFKNNHVRILGIDPVCHIVEMAKERGIETICGFFGLKSAQEIKEKYGKCSIITSTNSFAHVPDLDNVMHGVNELLSEPGIFILENPDYLNTVKSNAFEQAYHAHYSYLSLKPLVQYMKQFGMEVFKVESNDMHTGSFRVFACRGGKREIDKSVEDYLNKEKEFGLHDLSVLKAFSNKVKKIKIDLISLLYELKRNGKSIALLSCPSKSSTLLNYLKLDNEVFDFATEKSNLKVGKYTPGSMIKIYNDEELLKRQPDYALLGAWNFRDEIVKNNIEYLQKGGKIICPLPEIEIVEYEVIID